MIQSMPDRSRDKELLRAALALARRSMDKGNLPFGCVMADKGGNIIEEGENTVVTTGDSIAHCEINLVHKLAGKFDLQFLEGCTIYASTEPCPMCTAAIFWAGIGRIVFALGKDSYHSIARTTNPSHLFDLSAEKLLSYAKRPVKISGPLLEAEAAELYTAWLSG